MKRSDLIFGAVLVPLDYLMLIVAGLVAYLVRFSNFYIENIREATEILTLNDYTAIVFLVSIIWLIVFSLAGLYNLKTHRKFIDEFSKILLACSTGILVVVIFIFLNRELFASRFIVLAAWFLAIIFVSFGRVLAIWAQRKFFRKGIGVHKVIIIGANITADRLVRLFKLRPSLGYQVVRQFPDFRHDKVVLLGEILQHKQIDELLLADTNLPEDERYRLLEAVNEYHLDFRYTADLLSLPRANIEIETFGGMPIVEVKKTPLEGWGRISKRIFDVLFALLGLLILLLPFILIAIAIKLGSKGTILYRSWRVGGRGKKFGLYKFRTMIPEAHQLKYSSGFQQANERADGPLFKLTDDPRVTKIGKFLRRWSLDELPQLFNVIKGELSMVGPRPHEPEEVAKYARHHKRLLDIKPGVTGFAQVSGRSDLVFEEEVKLDVYYIENWSIGLDLKIILQTPKAVLSRRIAE